MMLGNSGTSLQYWKEIDDTLWEGFKAVSNVTAESIVGKKRKAVEESGLARTSSSHQNQKKVNSTILTRIVLSTIQIRV